MKMNKIIIPAAALAMGVALVGSVSSTLAWYQYSTKAQAAYIGTSFGESENLEIKIKRNNQDAWVSKADSDDIKTLIADDVGTNVIPVTPAVAANDGNLANNVALPTNFYNSVETGVGGRDSYGTNRYAAAENYIQFTMNVRYKQNKYTTSSTTQYVEKDIKLIDLTIVDTASTGDLYKAVRVHFSTSAGNSLFLRNNDSNDETVSTNTFGKLDTDSSGKLDTGWSYEWENSSEVVYGIQDSAQTAYNANYNNGVLNHYIGTTTSGSGEGLAITVTIWLEGWQKLDGTPANNYDAGDANANPARDAAPSAMWDPTVYTNKQFKIGMRFQAE